jgi:hypothetical protein
MRDVPNMAEAVERLSRELPAISQNVEFRKRVIDIGQGVTGLAALAGVRDE